jgi:hypothetical protein
MRDCIDAFCHQCMNHDLYAIANCANEDCPLYSVRPNQSLKGMSADTHEDDLVKREVIDDLELKGLKEKTHVPL